MKKWTMRLLVLVGALSLTLFAGCGPTENTDEDAGNGDMTDTGNGGNGGWSGGEAVECDGAEIAEWIEVSPEGGPAYSPGEVTVSTGDVVGWRWNDSNHSVTAMGSDSCDDWKNDWFNAGPKSEGNWCFEFQEANTYWYGCTVGEHCANGMKATVTVE